MASLHRSRRTRPFRQAHRIAPPREVRQAHPRLRARLRPWRSPLALAFVAGVSLLSLVPLPTAFGAAPAERPSNAPAGPTVAAADRAGGPALASAARPADRPSAPSTREGDSRAAPAATVAVVDALPAAADAPRPTGPDTSGPKDQPQRDAGTAADRGVASPPARSSAEPRSATGSKALRTAKAGSSPTPRAARTGTTASAGVAPLRPTVRGSLAGTRPVAGFLGDSYTTGWAGAGIGASGWPALVSTALGLRTSNAAVAGSGFVNPGWTGQPVATRLATVVRADPRIVFVAAGHNDRRFGASAASRAADAVLARLRAALPTSVIVVLGPIWQDGRPPASLVGLRDHLRSTARRVGAVFVDPLAGGWFAGAGHALIGPDGIHPTAAGHRRIAAFVLAALRARGVVAASLRGP